MSYSGPTISLANMSSGERKDFIVSVSQQLFVEEDESKACRNYPNNQFTTFSDCDELFVRTSLSSLAPPDFLPIWATENTTEVTKLVAGQMSGLALLTVDKLREGSRQSSCPASCTSTTISARHILTGDTFSDHSAVIFTFSDVVMVTHTGFPAFSLAQELATLGGSMGLWLGLGVLQVLEILVRLLLVRTK